MFLKNLPCWLVAKNGKVDVRTSIIFFLTINFHWPGGSPTGADMFYPIRNLSSSSAFLHSSNRWLHRHPYSALYWLSREHWGYWPSGLIWIIYPWPPWVRNDCWMVFSVYAWPPEAESIKCYWSRSSNWETNFCIQNCSKRSGQEYSLISYTHPSILCIPPPTPPL